MHLFDIREIGKARPRHRDTHDLSEYLRLAMRGNEALRQVGWCGNGGGPSPRSVFGKGRNVFLSHFASLYRLPPSGRISQMINRIKCLGTL